ncbi:MAG TPA: hypothetical protein PKG60_13025 [Spirochaetota bacterium]|jgi:hypothetical protein|nr:hypothetical protein [Spirochaetota bacterium]HPS87275.1 hypothetical protein [Spirochaetota bacterium]
MKIIIIRQPDINSYLYLSDEFAVYGRFGLTKSGAFYVLPLNSSHPDNTLIGGFWAANKVKDILYLYPHGSVPEFEIFVKDIIESRQIDNIAEAAGLEAYQ